MEESKITLLGVDDRRPQEPVDIRVYSYEQHLGGMKEIDWVEEEIELSCSLKVSADLTGSSRIRIVLCFVQN